ncbi:MAG: HAD family phosphatase [Bacteroidia bacterium]|nr:HAD family phosphatase [Bacteroidia bacterium]
MSLKSIRNIIFDLGGVILNIDPQLTVDAFHNLGWNDFYEGDNQSLNKELFYNLEKGNSSPEAFHDNVRKMINKHISDKEIDMAWTAMIIDIPADRVRYLEELKKSYKLYLLSNTNEIHRLKFHRNFEADFGYTFYDLFERNFYSHEMKMRKPNPQIYLQAIKEANIVPEETLFIDDMEENIEAAKSTGMKVLHIQPGTLLQSLPRYLEDNQQ